VPAVTIRAFINDCAASGQSDDITGNTLIVKHRSAAGELRASHTLAVPFGDWELPCPGPRIRTGDRLQFFEEGSVSPFREFTVPELRIRTDRVANRIQGVAPDSPSEVLMSYLACDAAMWLCNKTMAEPIDVDPGTGRYDEPAGLDITGTTKAVLIWRKGLDSAVLTQAAGRLVVRPGSAAVSGTGSKVEQPVALSLRRGQAIGRATVTTGPNASFSATIKRAGSPMKAKVGDVISASFSSDAVLTVPASSLGIVPDGVAGRCFKNRQVIVLVRTATGQLDKVLDTMTGPTGRWSVDMVPSAGFTVEAWCNNAKGDAIVQKIVAL
jgi:hypothetical protein